jgi:NAD(P)-dependent dehydrogenase (short-subunit alcohol dehydrogenase family)
LTPSRDPFRLDGQVALVTGGLGRLGSEYARALSTAGAAVALFDIASPLSETVQRLIDGGASIAVHRVDVTNRVEVDRAVAAITSRFGAPTVLVNNAGLGSSPADAALETGPFETYPESAWDAMLDSHLKSALVASQSFLAAFRAAGRTSGSIINVSSTYGMVAPEQAVYDDRRRDGAVYFKPVGYSVAKSGVLNFTRWLAEYCGHERLNVRVNTLVPGGVRERGHAPAFVTEYEKRTPLGRMARDDDYNGAIVFLASPASAYMTGATLVVDGGWTAR